MKKLMLIGLIALASLAQTSSSRGIKTVLSGSRPLSEAADLIERKFGVCVNYEDPQYRDSRNLEDVTAEVASLQARQKNPSLRVVIPRRASLEIQSPVPALGLGDADILGIANSAVLDHNARGNPGVFRVVSSGRRLSIVPVQGTDLTGRAASEPVLLDTRIQVQPLRGTTGDALREILSVLGASSGKTIQLGMTPNNLMYNTEVDHPETAGPARDLLVRVVDGMKWRDKRLTAQMPKVSWRLYFDQNMDAFVVNLRIVMVESKNIEGDVVLSPLLESASSPW